MKGLDDGPDGLNEAAFDRALGIRKPPRVNPDPALHLEGKTGRSYCGRKLKAADFFIDCEAQFEEREGSRCKTCWRVYSGRQRDRQAVTP